MSKNRAEESRSITLYAQRLHRLESSRARRILDEKDRAWFNSQMDAIHATIDRRARIGEEEAQLDYEYIIKKSAMLLRIKKLQRELIREGYAVTVTAKEHDSYASLVVSW